MTNIQELALNYRLEVSAERANYDTYISISYNLLQSPLNAFRNVPKLNLTKALLHQDMCLPSNRSAKLLNPGKRRDLREKRRTINQILTKK